LGSAFGKQNQTSIPFFCETSFKSEGTDYGVLAFVVRRADKTIANRGQTKTPRPMAGAFLVELVDQ
jgi:hypothetical protein